MCNPASICSWQWFGSCLTRSVFKGQCFWFCSMLYIHLRTKMSVRSHTPIGLRSHHHCNVQICFSSLGRFSVLFIAFWDENCRLLHFGAEICHLHASCCIFVLKSLIWSVFAPLLAKNRSILEPAVAQHCWHHVYSGVQYFRPTIYRS